MAPGALRRKQELFGGRAIFALTAVAGGASLWSPTEEHAMDPLTLSALLLTLGAVTSAIALLAGAGRV